MVGLVVCASAMIFSISAYWRFFDRVPPVQDVTGTVISYNPSLRVAVIEYEALKNRHCEGQRFAFQLQDGPEPPPRSLAFLDPVTLPPEDFKGPPTPTGKRKPWRIVVKFEDNDIPAPFWYGGRWMFQCNPLQKPIEVPMPMLKVGG